MWDEPGIADPGGGGNGTSAIRLREIKAIMKAMKESGLTKAAIVTLNHEEHLKTEAGHIQILPA